MNKPFPWTCGHCATKTVMPKIDNFSIKVKRNNKLYDVHLKNVEIPTCTSCNSQWIDISFDDKIEEELQKVMAQTTEH